MATVKKSKAAEVRVLLAEGLATSEIASRLKLTTAYVSQIKWHWNGGKKSKRIKFVKQANVKPRSVREAMRDSMILKSVKEARDILSKDMVNSPPHYTKGGIETIDFIEAKGLEADYYLANVVKYVSRANEKGNLLEDLKKAQWYLTRRIEKIEGIKSQG